MRIKRIYDEIGDGIVTDTGLRKVMDAILKSGDRELIDMEPKLIRRAAVRYEERRDVG